MAAPQLRADQADCHAYLAGLVPPVVDAQGRSQQGVEAAAAEPLTRELLVRHVQRRFLLVAQKEYQQEALAVVTVRGSCPVLSNRASPLVQDAHYEDRLVHHRVAKAGDVWRSAGHQVESAPGDLVNLRVLVAIIPLVEARVDPVLDVHESTRHGLGAFEDLIVGHLVLRGERDPHLVSHGSHHVEEDANAHVGLATQALVERDRRDMEEDHGTIHREDHSCVHRPWRDQMTEGNHHVGGVGHP